MATLIDLKTSISNVLKLNFPKHKLYSSEVAEGFQKPCFFTSVVPLRTDYDSVSYSSSSVMIVINFFSENGTQEESYPMFSNIKEAFGMSLKVKNRSFLIRNFRSDIVDGVLQTKFNLEFLVDGDRSRNLEDDTEYELMQEIYLDLKRRD